MKKLLIILVMLVGCASLATFTNKVRERNRSNLMRLSLGMTKMQALDIMGTEKDKMTSVSQADGATILYPRTQIINNPYRSAAFTRDSLNIEVLYYYTDLKQQDGAITDDELTPLVFFDNKLVGWGWDYWDDVTTRYEIRIR